MTKGRQKMEGVHLDWDVWHIMMVTNGERHVLGGITAKERVEHPK